MFETRLRLLTLGISPDEATFERRAFPIRERCPARAHLETVGRMFIYGYNSALAHNDGTVLAKVLDRSAAEYRGFAYEGAAMACGVLDSLTPWHHKRWSVLVDGPARHHIYMMHVGLGWAMARVPGKCLRMKKAAYPLLEPLVYDGYGFHEGYFHWQNSVSRQNVPSGLDALESTFFDQGLGRSLWFVFGARPQSIADAVKQFPEARQPNLWSGVGLASSYAGGASLSDLELIRLYAGKFTSHVGQGAVFAAKTRKVAGNPSIHTENACRAFCAMTADSAARLSDDALETVQRESSPVSATAQYERWRSRIRDGLRVNESAAPFSINKFPGGTKQDELDSDSCRADGSR